MNNQLFKLTDPITRVTIKQFEAEHNFKPTREADLRDFGYAWGSVDPRPDAPDGQIVEPKEPILEGAFVTVRWITRDPTPEEIETERVRKYREVIRSYSEAMRPIGSAYPPEEREGWAEQVAAAQEVVTGGQNDLIDALRAPTGETALEMAQRIIAKRGEYLVAYGQVTAARRALDAQIAAATDLADLQSIDVRKGFGLT